MTEELKRTPKEWKVTISHMMEQAAEEACIEYNSATAERRAELLAIVKNYSNSYAALFGGGNGGNLQTEFVRRAAKGNIRGV
jgi:hypothetical protein